MGKVQVYYFPMRGRGEPIRVALAAKGVEFEHAGVDYAEMKSDLTKYKFNQCPRLVDDDVDVCQSNAVLRHVGRKYDMYGKGLKEAAAVDEVVDGVEDLKAKYLALIYQDELADAAKQSFWDTHCDPASINKRNSGIHLAYISKLAAPGTTWLVSDELSIADIVVWDMYDLLARIFPDTLAAAYPDLAAHQAKLAAVPGVKAYLEGPLRLPKVNYNGLGCGQFGAVTMATEAVALELVFLPLGIAVALHVRRGQTPIKSFGSPLFCSDYASSTASTALQDCATSKPDRCAARVAGEPEQAATAAPCLSGGSIAPADEPTLEQADGQHGSSATSCNEQQRLELSSFAESSPAAVLAEPVASSRAFSDSGNPPQQQVPANSPPASELSHPVPPSSTANLQPDDILPATAAGVACVASAAAATQPSAQPPHQGDAAPEQPDLTAAAAAAASKEGRAVQDGTSAAVSASNGGACVPPGATPSMDAVMSMLQQLLAGQEQVGLHQELEASPLQPLLVLHPQEIPQRSGEGREGLPVGVEKLLALELEVVQLQQSLQIAQLDFEARSVQLHRLKQRAESGEERAQGAEERCNSLDRQVLALQRQVGSIAQQLKDVSAQQQQERKQSSADLAAACARQQAGDEAAAALRQQLAAAKAAAEQTQLLLRQATARQAELQEQVANLQLEKHQLKAHVAAACSSLKAQGIPAGQVFDTAALVEAGLPSSSSCMRLPPESPAGGIGKGGASVYHSFASETASQQQQQQLERPPQLSSISLEQLQQHVTQQQQQQQGVVDQQPHAPHQHAAAQIAAPRQRQFISGMVGVGLPESAPPPIACSPAGTSGSSPGPMPASARYRQRTLSLPPLQLPLPEALPPLASARRAVSPAQQELLASARQWQLSARSSPSGRLAEQEEHSHASAFIPAYRPHNLHATAAPVALSARCPPATARLARGAACQQTPRQRRGASAAASPVGKLQRRTYGQEAGFQDIKQAYQAVVAGEADRARNWARSVFSSSSAVESDPRKVEPVVQGLLQLFQDNGVHVPLLKCGPCQFRLGSAKLSVRLVNGRLMARGGAGQTMDVFAWLEKQPVRQQC
ncbi:Glutathione S-transferase P [Chlorella vulgaris]